MIFRLNHTRRIAMTAKRIMFALIFAGLTIVPAAILRAQARASDADQTELSIQELIAQGGILDVLE
jgi:spore maturation protein SpmA